MLSLVLYLVFSISFVVDIFFDLNEKVAFEHVLHEFLLLTLSLSAAIYQTILLSRQKKKIVEVQEQLVETTNSYLSWKAKSRHSAQQIRQAIDLQFDEWGLSPSEKDVALFLVKGLSMKEIANIRETQDKTVRQQATQIYKKADVGGRQELAAFFLEDIVASPDS
jgi:DNA-binding NarL/FixJ family response regulator